MNRYDLIYLDPPWRYKDEKSNLPKLGGKTYPTIKDTDMGLLPIDQLGEKNSLMFCWGVWPKAEELYALMRLWGYTPVTVGFVWVKYNKSGNGFYSGLGSYVCGNSEFCYIGKKGKGLKRANKSVKQLLLAPIGKHSEKPREAYERIDTLYPEASKIELFGRRQNPPPGHWNATGFDFDGKDIKDFLKEEGCYERAEENTKTRSREVEWILPEPITAESSVYYRAESGETSREYFDWMPISESRLDTE